MINRDEATFDSETLSTISQGQASVALQHDWRRRGFLPPNSAGGRRPVRYSLKEAAMVLVLARLAAVGVGPNVGQRMAESAANLVMFHALQQPGATVGSTTVVGPDQKLPRYLASIDGAEACLTDSLDATMKDGGGHLSAIDLHHLGKQLATGAGRPLVIVTGDPE